MTLSWMFWVLWATYLGIIISAGWVVFDSLRPARRARVFAMREVEGFWREPIYVYTAYCGMMVVLWVVQQILTFVLPIGDDFRAKVSLVAILWTTVGIFVMLIYLLRMVFIVVPEGDRAEPDDEPTTMSDKLVTSSKPTDEPVQGSSETSSASADAPLPSRRDRKRRR